MKTREKGLALTQTRTVIRLVFLPLDMVSHTICPISER
ncbi:hypothetical protein HNP72_000087 [Sphingobacterium soli]|nr:hypothetical protein [Sphingobacterium soli]